jgi:hypothetical protein
VTIHRVRRAARAALLAALCLSSGVLGAGLGAGPAAAAQPLELEKQITDRAHVLGDDQPKVRRALDKFYERTGLRMHVVYVGSFSGMRPEQWAGETANRSGLPKKDVLLVFAEKSRSVGHVTANPDLPRAELEQVDETRIAPALRNDDYAQATIDAAAAYGDIAEDAALPWAWIVSALAAAGLLLWVLVLRSRRRFDHTHHVLDEHGRPVDPASILTLPEIDQTSAAALVAIDDALHTAASDVARAAEQLGADRVASFQATVDEGREKLGEAFRIRHKLDKLIARRASTDDDERKWRKRASRIIALCEEVDAALDSHTSAFDDARDLKNTAESRRAVLTEEVERLAARVPDLRNEFDELSTRSAWTVTGNLELATALLDAATTQLRDGNDHAATRIRVAEDAASTAAGLLDAVADADHRSNPDESALVADAELYVASRRGAVGVKARTLRSEARRHLRLAEEAVDAKERSARLHSAAADAGRSLESAIADVTNWQASRAAHDERHGRRFDSLVLAGVLVDEADSGELRSLLGGSSHGGGSGAPYRGIESGGTQRTAGSFGGTTTRGRHGGFSFGGSPAKMTP